MESVKIQKSPELIQTIKEIKEKLANENVKRVLAKLKRTDKIWEYGFSERFSEDDMRGIDAYIYPQEGTSPILLQMKFHLAPETIQRLQLIQVAPEVFYGDGIYTISCEREKEVEEKILRILEREEK